MSIHDQFDMKPHKRVKKDSFELTPEFKRSVWINRIIQFVLILIIGGLALTSGYIGFKGPIKIDKKWEIPVKNNPTVGNKAIATNMSDNILTRFNEAIIGPENVIIGELIAGPSGEIREKGGVLSVEIDEVEIETNVNLDSHAGILNSEYIIRCESGSCKKGQDYLVNKNQVKGSFIEDLNAKK